MSLPEQVNLGLTPGYRFQWEEAQKCYVLLYPEGMVKLNESAAEVLKRVDGSRNLEEIIRDLQRAFPDADLADDVRALLEEAHDRGWIHHA